MLLSAAERWAAERGESKILLTVRAANAVAIKLYRSSGYVQIGNVCGFVLLEKKLRCEAAA